MAEVRTQLATVDRLVGDKGVAIIETVILPSGKSFDLRMTAWLGEGHGLRRGDQARFYGQLGVKTREYNGKWYADTSLSNAQVLPGTLIRAAQDDATAGAWATATPGEKSAWDEARQ